MRKKPRPKSASIFSRRNIDIAKECLTPVDSETPSISGYKFPEYKIIHQVNPNAAFLYMVYLEKSSENNHIGFALPNEEVAKKYGWSTKTVQRARRVLYARGLMKSTAVAYEHDYRTRFHWIQLRKLRVYDPLIINFDKAALIKEHAELENTVKEKDELLSKIVIRPRRGGEPKHESKIMIEHLRDFITHRTNKSGGYKKAPTHRTNKSGPTYKSTTYPYTPLLSNKLDNTKSYPSEKNSEGVLSSKKDSPVKKKSPVKYNYKQHHYDLSQYVLRAIAERRPTLKIDYKCTHKIGAGADVLRKLEERYKYKFDLIDSVARWTLEEGDSFWRKSFLGCSTLLDRWKNDLTKWQNMLENYNEKSGTEVDTEEVYPVSDKTMEKVMGYIPTMNNNEHQKLSSNLRKIAAAYPEIQRQMKGNDCFKRLYNTLDRFVIRFIEFLSGESWLKDPRPQVLDVRKKPYGMFLMKVEAESFQRIRGSK